MKYSFLSAMTIISGSCLLFVACNKEMNDVIYDRKQVSPVLIEAAKKWDARHIDMKAVSRSGYGLLTRQWENSWTVNTTDGNTLLVVSAPEHHVDNKDFSIRRFFIFRADGRTITDGRIIELVGRKYNVEDNLDFLLKNYNQDMITGFNGGILQYDVSYRFITDAVYVYGRKNNNIHTRFITLPARSTDSLIHTSVVQLRRNTDNSDRASLK